MYVHTKRQWTGCENICIINILNMKYLVLLKGKNKIELL